MNKNQSWLRVVSIYCAAGPILGAFVVLVGMLFSDLKSNPGQFAALVVLIFLFGFAFGLLPALAAGLAHVVASQVFGATKISTQLFACVCGLSVHAAQLFSFGKQSSVQASLGAFVGFVLPPLVSAFVLSAKLYACRDAPHRTCSAKDGICRVDNSFVGLQSHTPEVGLSNHFEHLEGKAAADALAQSHMKSHASHVMVITDTTA